MRKINKEIRTYNLDASLYQEHKDCGIRSDFGLDNSSELIDNGFGLYSSANIKSTIGPVKTQYYRVSLVRTGTTKIDMGIETYQPACDWMVFGFPGQVFSLYDKSRQRPKPIYCTPNCPMQKSLISWISPTLRISTSFLRN